MVNMKLADLNVTIVTNIFVGNSIKICVFKICVYVVLDGIAKIVVKLLKNVICGSGPFCNECLQYHNNMEHEIKNEMH